MTLDVKYISVDGGKVSVARRRGGVSGRGRGRGRAGGGESGSDGCGRGRRAGAARLYTTEPRNTQPSH